MVVTMEFKHNSYNVKAEIYSSFYAMCSEVRTKPPYPCSNDFFGNATPDSPDWYGFKDGEELRRMMTEGIVDKSQVKNILKLAGADKNKGKPKFTNHVKRADEGDDLVIDALIRKEPKCWDLSYRKRKPSDIIDIAIEMSINGHIKAKDLLKAGAAVASTIQSIENRGLKTRITSVIGYHDWKEVGIAAIPIKTERTRINYPFLLFTMSPAFERGVDFGWTCRFRQSNCMGASFNGIGTNNKEAILRRILKNDNVNLVNMELLASRAQYSTMEDLIAAAKDMIAWRD